MKGKKRTIRLTAMLMFLALSLQTVFATGTPVALADEPGDGGSIVIGPGAETPTPVPTATPDGGTVVAEPGDVTTGPAVDPATRPDPEAVSLSAVKLALHPVQEERLTVSGCVTGAGCDIRMNSSDTHVVTVKNNGKVRGENPGSATITAEILWCGEPVKALTCDVTVTAGKVSYSTLRKKLYGQRADEMFFTDESSSCSELTYFGFFYRAFRLHPENYTYGSGDETITLYPVIQAKKDGSHGKLQFGIKLSSFVEIANRVSRSYKTMKFSGGGESFSINGSTTCRAKTIDSYIRWQIRTNGTFYLSADSNTHLVRLDKLNRILSSKKPKIIVKDTVDHRTYKCQIAKDRAKGLKKMVKKYKKLLKAFW